MKSRFYPQSHFNKLLLIMWRMHPTKSGQSHITFHTNNARFICGDFEGFFAANIALFGLVLCHDRCRKEFEFLGGVFFFKCFFL